jgi:SAM-dependent methyltransferase
MTHCPICGGPEIVVLSKEMNVSCGDYFEGRRLYTKDLGEQPLLQCQHCGYGRFPVFAGWPDERFQSDIYNADYYLCDKPFLFDRPVKLANWLAPILAGRSVLDYGGGNGLMAERLKLAGIAAISYDPFYDTVAFPTSKFDVVTAFEVVEHVPDQASLFKKMASLLKPDGCLIFSTLLQPDLILPDWWYASPRNGHTSFHSRKSLKALADGLGLVTHSLSNEIHLVATDPANFSVLTSSPIIPITDQPAFRFKNGWSHMVAGV